MKIYIMTDLECVAGVETLPEYCLSGPENKYHRREGGRLYETARALATQEVNAAIEGLIDGGAEQIVVCDGHGHGGLHAGHIHRQARVVSSKDRVPGYYHPGLDGTFNAAMMIGQHAKANVDGGHLCHSGSFSRHEWLLNRQLVGEIALFAFATGSMNVPLVMISGDVTACEEARCLVPDIEAVAVIEGLKMGSAWGLTTDENIDLNVEAEHLSPEESRSRIRAGAARVLDRVNAIPAVTPPPGPYEMVRISRPGRAGQVPMLAINRANDLDELMCQKPKSRPLDRWPVTVDELALE